MVISCLCDEIRVLGANGYDHKKMGITARGAWESVKRLFAEQGRDCQSQDFTVVAVGDMAGDVFGNGMLLSKHVCLQAALAKEVHKVSMIRLCLFIITCLYPPSSR